MRGLFGLGIVLLLVGLAILAWPAIPYTESKKAVDIGPIEVETETQKQIALATSPGSRSGSVRSRTHRSRPAER